MKSLSYVLFLAALVCSGCENSDNSRRSATAEFKTGETRVNTEAPVEKREQRLIKEGYLRFETQNLDKTYQEIIAYVKENEGYLQSDESGKGYNELNRNLVIRIPSKNFQKIIDAISKNVSFFDTKRISSTDVTEEFIDLEARLKTKRTLENRYLELLAKAQNVNDIIDIEKELASIREEIEAQEGRLKYLENRVSYSTLTVNFYKRTAETGITVSYGSKIWNALKSGVNGLSSFFLGLIHIWPFIIILGIVIIIIRKKFFKKEKK